MLKANSRLRVHADWWSQLTPEGQSEYLSEHPDSEKAKQARQKAEEKHVDEVKNEKGDEEAPVTKGEDDTKKDEEKAPETKGEDEEAPVTKGEEEEKAPETKDEEAPETKDETDEAPVTKGEDKKDEEAPETKGEEKEAPKKEHMIPLAPGKSLASYAKSLDDPDATPDTVYANFHADDVEEMKSKAKEAMSLEPTDRLMGEPNVYPEERLKMHREIIAHFLSPEKIKAATPKPGEKPRFVVLGGRGGSGKSGFSHDENTGAPPKVNEFDSREFLMMDADAIKGMLKPPYEGWNANQVHEESSFLFDKITDAAKKMNLNIVSDATLKSDKMGPVLEDLTKSGYDIEGHYMFLPRQKAAQRACGRYLGKGKDDRGRLVPPEIILGNTKNEENFDKLKKHFKKWSCYDNDSPHGEGPRLINRGEATKEEKAKLMSKTVTTAAGTKDDQWENDPYLTRTPAREKKIRDEALKTLHELGVDPKTVKDPHFAKEYQEYVKKHEKEQKDKKKEVKK